MRGQSRRMSAIEQTVSTFIGLAVAITTQVLVFPLFGINIPLHDNFLIAGIFTAVSILRGYVIRRVFNWIHLRNHRGLS